MISMSPFFQNACTVIGMVHFSPLQGDPAFLGKEEVLARAKEDLSRLVKGGVGAVLFENNFDNPKFERLPREQAEHFEELVAVLTKTLEVPWGIAALWNDYALGFRLCQMYGGSAVRVPVFVDSVDTVYGRFLADPKKVLQVRVDLQAEEVLILADVQVKHATMLAPRPLEASVKEAIEQGADGVIITGAWTGDPPTGEMVSCAREVVGDKGYVLTGSGMTPENIRKFKPFLDGCIVGSAFKEDTKRIDGPNIVGPEVRYDLEKINRFVRAVRE